MAQGQETQEAYKFPQKGRDLDNLFAALLAWQSGEQLGTMGTLWATTLGSDGTIEIGGGDVVLQRHGSGGLYVEDSDGELGSVHAANIYAGNHSLVQKANKSDVVSAKEAQTFTEAQKAQARVNIGAASQSDLDSTNTRVTNIEGKIPLSASSSNQLADKEFVNSSVSTSTATYKGNYNVVTDLGLKYKASNSQVANALSSAVSGADNNDYVFVSYPVSATSDNILYVKRFKYNGSAWQYEYTLNNSGFTSAQWSAINSGMTETGNIFWTEGSNYSVLGINHDEYGGTRMFSTEFSVYMSDSRDERVNYKETVVEPNKITFTDEANNLEKVINAEKVKNIDTLLSYHLKYFDLRDYLESNKTLPNLTYNIPRYDGQPCAVKIYANDNDEDEPIHTYIAYRGWFEACNEPFTDVATFDGGVFVKTESIYEFAHPELFSANALECISQEQFDTIFNFD